MILPLLICHVASGGGLPDGTVARLGDVSFRHDSPIRCITFSTDGKRLACGGEGTIGVLDAQNGELLLHGEVPGGGILVLGFSPSGDRLVSASANGVARLWNLAGDKAEPVWSHRWVEGPATYRTRRADIRFTSDGDQVILTDSRRAFWTLDAKTGQPCQAANEPRGQLASLSADGRLFYVARSGNKIGVRETLADGRRDDIVLDVPGLRVSPADAASTGMMMSHFGVAPEGKFMLVGTAHTLAAVDAASGKLLGTVAGRPVLGNDGEAQTAFSSDAKLLAVLWSTVEGATVEVHAWPDGKMLHRVVLGHRPAAAPTFSPDGKCLAVADDARVRLWDLVGGKEIGETRGHDDDIVSVIFSPDGARTATVAMDQTSRLWETATGRMLHKFPVSCSPESEHAAAFSPEGRLLAVDQGDAITLIDVAEGTDARRLAWPGDPTTPSGPRVVAFSPEGKRLVAWSFVDAALRQWDVASGTPLDAKPLEVGDRKAEPEGSVLLGLAAAAVFSPDLELLAATRFFGENASAWQTRTGRRCFNLTTRAPITSVQFSPDGKTLAVGRTSGLIQLWDPRENRLRQSLEGPSCGSFPRAFLDDGRTLVSDHPDNTSRFWDVASGREIQELTGYRLWACSPDGRWGVSVSPRQEVLVWELSRIRKSP